MHNEVLELRAEIENLDWCPNGEALVIYHRFLKTPFMDGFSLFKLLICLVYEENYREAQQFAKYVIEEKKGDCSAEIYFFYGVSSDMLLDRKQAICAYNEVLNCEFIPPSVYGQLYIEPLCKEFVEYLLVHPYTKNCGEHFPFPPTEDSSIKAPEYYQTLLNEPYAFEETLEYPPFSYELHNDSLLSLKMKYDLPSVAGSGDEINQIINLMWWVHDHVKWDGLNGIKAKHNALSILEESFTNGTSFNCRGVAIVLSEVYLAMGFKAKFVTCMPKSRQDGDCHIVTIVYSQTQKKWMMMDACLQNYISDSEGNILSIQEIREGFVQGMPLRFAQELNVNHNDGEDCSWYKEYYLRKNFYRFGFYTISGFGCDDQEHPTYVGLVPEGYEALSSKPKRDNGGIVTSNPEYFWGV